MALNSIGQEIMQAIDRSLAPAPPKDATIIAAEQIRRVISEKFSCPPEAKKQLLDIDREYVAADSGVLAHGYAESKVAFIQEMRRQEALLASGKYDSENFWTQAEVSSDYEVRRAGFKRRKVMLSLAALKIAQPLCAEVSTLINNEAYFYDQRDMKEYARLSVTYSTSSLVLRLRELAKVVMQRVTNVAGTTNPRSFSFLFE